MYPTIFGIGSYIIMAIIGFAAAFLVAWFRRCDFDYTVRDIVAMLLVCIMGLLLGAKLLFIITMIPEIIDNFGWDIIKDRVINGGLVFYGGLFGALFCIRLLAKTMKRDAGQMLNYVIPCYAAFHAFGRIGCLLEGCCYGKVAEHGIARVGENFNRVPIQLIEAIGIAVILALLLVYERYAKKKGFTERLVPAYFLLYGTLRFIDEFWRGDILRGVTDIKLHYFTENGKLDINMSLSTSQIISLIMIIATLVYLLHVYITKKKIKSALTSTAGPADNNVTQKDGV